MTTRQTLANLAAQSYFEHPDLDGYSGYNEINFYSDSDFRPFSGDTGFTAHSYYSQADNTLVVSYAGTDPTSPSDVKADAWLAFGNNPAQAQQATDFLFDSYLAADIQYDNFNVVVTGHSLGGYLAQ